MATFQEWKVARSILYIFYGSLRSQACFRLVGKYQA